MKKIIKDTSSMMVFCSPKDGYKSIAFAALDSEKDNGLKRFRFHDLRHYSASIRHALNVPDAYIMQEGGWSSDSTLKSVYRHALDDEQDKMADIAIKYFDAISHEISHKKKRNRVTTRFRGAGEDGLESYPFPLPRINGGFAAYPSIPQQNSNR